MYYNVDVLLHKTSMYTLGYQTHKIPRLFKLSKTNIMKTQYGKLNMINTSFIVAPVKNHCYHDVLPPSNRAIHSKCDIENVTTNTVIHGNCFNNYDTSSLGNIDPDINYYKTSNSTPYYDDQTFREKNGNNIKLSMFHLNITKKPHVLTATEIVQLIEYLCTI